MLRDSLSMVIASIWSSMANWSTPTPTPTFLFCLLNLMIIIIFIASNSIHHPRNNNSPNQITRSPSLLERVKSMNLSSSFYGHYEDQYETTRTSEFNSVSRRPSLLERVKSIDFSFYTSTPSSDSVSYSNDSPSQLTRVPSLLDRIKSFKLTSSFNSNHGSGDTFSSHDQQSDMDLDPSHGSVRDNDETKSFGDDSSMVKQGKSEKSSKTPVKMKPRGKNRVVESKKSDAHVDQHGSTPASTKVTIGARNECVDAKADDFIKRFKQQLKLQRIDSLQRFREMLNRSS